VKLGNPDRLRVVQKDLVTYNNTPTAGTTISAMTLGLATTVTTQYVSTLGLFVPRLVTLGGLYRQFSINSIKFEWVPNQGYNTSGTVVMGVDPSPLAGVPSGTSSVMHHSSAKLFDIKAGASIVWKPSDESKKGVRYTTGATGLDEDELSYGVFQLYSANGVAASANVGNLVVTADITYSGAM